MAEISEWSDLMEEKMWCHKCKVEGEHYVGKNEECNWCGATEEKEKAVIDNIGFFHSSIVETINRYD